MKIRNKITGEVREILESELEKYGFGGKVNKLGVKNSLWNNIRANKGSGKKPTKQMLEQAKKIQAEEMMYGGMVDEYLNGGGINNPGFKALPKEVQENIIANMAMGGDVEEYANGGGIPERYKNMGFTRVGQKKQGDGKHKWKVLAKKGDKYKVVQGGWRGMQDFKQHKSQERRDRFWDRMGGRNSAKAKDPFSPLYWHKRFGTWADGGILPDVQQLILAGQDIYQMGGMVEYPTYYPGGGMIGGPMLGYDDDMNYMYAMGGEVNSFTDMVPVQTEKYEGQPEQVALPDGTIKSVEAKTAHENMEDDTVTDLLPPGSHIQSSRNKLTPEQYISLLEMTNPEEVEKDAKKLAQVYESKFGKKTGKKLSPSDISEYAKKKYQTKSTPNSFSTDKLKEGNKQAYLQLSMQMNDLIKAGKEIGEGVLPEQMMAWGGMIPKFNPGGIVEYTGGKSKTPTGKSNKYNKDKSYLTQWKNAIENIENLSNEEAQGLIYDYTLKTNPEEVKNMWSNYGLTLKGRKSPILSKKYPEGKVDASKLTESDLKELREAYIDGFFGARQLNPVLRKQLEPASIIQRNQIDVTPTPMQVVAPRQMLSEVGQITPAARIPMQNRFNTGLLESQLARGLQGNQAYLNAAMDLSPVYTMETPDTFIRSRRNEIPVGNILYNIERAQRNTANALANQTGDWSTLASNIANAGAMAMNQVGDTLTGLNERNINLYNQTQGLQQDLLASNVGVRNQNITNMQNMLNYKRNLIGQKNVKDAELYSNYIKSLNEAAQQERNQKLGLMNIMASKPDMFKGEQGQMFANDVLGTYGSYNNPFAGTLLDFGFNLFGNRNRG